jgi:hypothetical protein
MKKIISDVINFPNDCETVQFTTCFVSMLMRAEGITNKDIDFFCSKQRGNCIRCGDCKNLVPILRKHQEIYHLYTAVTGYGFLQIDLSNDDHMSNDWDFTCQKLLREFDYFEEVQPPETKDSILAKIKNSVDKDIPVLLQLTHKYQWVLITGYDDCALYGFDGSQGYWGESPAKPTGYDENGMFILPDWYEKMAHVFILGKKKPPTVNIHDVFRRAIKIMESMKEKRYFRNSVEYMRNDANFDNLNDEELIKMRDRISQWIGQPIDQRAMLGYGMNPLRIGKALNQEIEALNGVHELCWRTHDVLWISWKGIGEYMGGVKLEWARGLKNKVIRNMIADCFNLVCDSDDMILDYLRNGFFDFTAGLTCTV